MAGYRIDINDARNAPVKPLEPPGGGSIPAVGVPQVNDETNTARTIGEVVTAGPHEGIDASYDPTTRAVRLRLTGAAQPGALGGMDIGNEGQADFMPIPGPAGRDGRDGALVQVLYEDVDPEPSFIIPGAKGDTGATGATGPAGSGSGGAGGMMPVEEQPGEDWLWLAGVVSDRLPLTGGALTGPLYVPFGTAALPGLGFNGDANTGFYRPAADTPAITAGGNEVARWTGASTSSVMQLRDSAVDGYYTQFVSNQSVGSLFHFSTTGSVILDLAARPIDAAGAATIRFFRQTDTAGTVNCDWYRGDNSSTVDHRFTSGGTGLTAQISRTGGRTLIGGGTDDGANTLQVFGTGVFAGDILVNNVVGQIGYTAGDGVGNSVTQLTSKATGVTLNHPVGQINTHNAALAANTTVSFTLTNSRIGSQDLVVVHRISGGTAASYQIWCTGVAAGSCTIAIRNISAGSLSEVIGIGFATIKGSVT